MQSSFSRKHHNPVLLMQQMYPEADLGHIHYNPELRSGQYSMIRQTGHDGTHVFTQQMLQRAFVPLITMGSYWKPLPPAADRVLQHVEYEVGPMRWVKVYGMLYLNCSTTNKYPGMRERIRFPVNCNFVYQET